MILVLIFICAVVNNSLQTDLYNKIQERTKINIPQIEINFVVSIIQDRGTRNFITKLPNVIKRRIRVDSKARTPKPHQNRTLKDDNTRRGKKSNDLPFIIGIVSGTIIGGSLFGGGIYFCVNRPRLSVPSSYELQTFSTQHHPMEPQNIEETDFSEISSDGELLETSENADMETAENSIHESYEEPSPNAENPESADDAPPQWRRENSNLNDYNIESSEESFESVDSNLPEEIVEVDNAVVDEDAISELGSDMEEEEVPLYGPYELHHYLSRAEAIRSLQPTLRLAESQDVIAVVQEGLDIVFENLMSSEINAAATNMQSVNIDSLRTSIDNLHDAIQELDEWKESVISDADILADDTIPEATRSDIITGRLNDYQDFAETLRNSLTSEP